MSMSTLTRWIAPLVLAGGFGAAALAPAPAHAQSGDELTRVIVDIADVIFRGGDPYYRHGRYEHDRYGRDDRLIVVRDRYGRPLYYREVPRHARSGPPYGNAYGYHRQAPGQLKVKCDRRGRCEVKGKRHYYDARYDSRRHDSRYDDPRHYSDRRSDDRRRDQRRWNERRRDD